MNCFQNKLKLTRNLKQRDHHPAQREALPERVSDAVLLLAENLRHDEEIVEEEYFSLVYTRPLLLVDVWDLVQSTIANQSSMRQGHVGLLANDRRLNLHHLRNVIRARFELVLLYPLVNSNQYVSVDVAAVVYASEIFHKVVQPHSTLWLQVRRVQVGVQHDYREGQYKNGVRRA